jgi:hypothetical protein
VETLYGCANYLVVHNRSLGAISKQATDGCQGIHG